MGRKKRRFTIRKDSFDAVIFDMDGIVTRTSKTHAEAWKTMFDNYLRDLTEKRGISYCPFSIEKDYRASVDGKPRYKGVQSFLESRRLDIPPWGYPDDPPGHETICGLGNRKNELFQELLKKGGIEVYASTVQLIHELKSRNFKTAIVTSSKNCEAILKAGKIGKLFDTKVDGLDSERLKLAGKPNPDIFICAAQKLRVDPARAVVIEDAVAGVLAGKRGHFGLVIGVDRDAQKEALLKNGADLTVHDLSEISLE
jgi:beta-phosphoglucomutase family hydrolase